MREILSSMTHHIQGLELCQEGDMVELKVTMDFEGMELQEWHGAAIYMGTEDIGDGLSANFLCDCPWWNADVKIIRVMANLTPEDR